MDSIYKHYGVHIRKSGTFVYPPGTYERVDSLWAGIYETHGERSLINMNVISEFDQLTEEENYPWYVWDVTFKENEKKTITVAYELPSGLGYRSSYRYFKYILHTGGRVVRYHRKGGYHSQPVRCSLSVERRNTTEELHDRP